MTTTQSLQTEMKQQRSEMEAQMKNQIAQLEQKLEESLAQNRSSLEATLEEKLGATLKAHLPNTSQFVTSDALMNHFQAFQQMMSKKFDDQADFLRDSLSTTTSTSSPPRKKGRGDTILEEDEDMETDALAITLDDGTQQI